MVNNAAVDIHVHVLCTYMFSVVLGQYLKVKMLKLSMCVCFLQVASLAGPVGDDRPGGHVPGLLWLLWAFTSPLECSLGCECISPGASGHSLPWTWSGFVVWVLSTSRICS